MSFFLLNGTIFGVTFGTGGEDKQVTPKLVSFSVSALAVVTKRAGSRHMKHTGPGGGGKRGRWR